MNWNCAICNGTSFTPHTAFEMMYGLRHEFVYHACNNCGCIQILKVPQDMNQYYPSNYYSFGKVEYRHRLLKVWLKKQLIKFHVYKKWNLLGFVFSKFYPNDEDFYPWFKKIQPKFDARILDVGCGSGNLLLKLRKSGYSCVEGADPFIKKDIFYQGGVVIHKKDLLDIKDTFDIIMFNHSLEHMPDQRKVLTRVHKMLKSGGVAIVRIPLSGTFAWRKYGVNWVQFDAPRHFYLHTVKSIEMLAKQTGFKKCDVLFDSNALQFWGSEQYLKDIPLRDKRSYAESPENSIFTEKQMDEFNEMAKKLNEENDGDAATFFLYA